MAGGSQGKGKITAGPRTYSPMIVGRKSTAQVFKAAGVSPPNPPGAAKAETGQHYPLSWTRNPRFAPALLEAINAHIGAEWELGHGGSERFLAYVQQAFQLLEGRAITLSALQGQVIELILPDLKEVRHIAVTVNHLLLQLAKEAVTSDKNVFVNAAGNAVKITGEFTHTTMIRDAWIRVKGQRQGKMYFDRGVLFANNAGQTLPGRHEYKAQEAGRRKLRGQVTEMDSRVKEFADVEGAELHYRVINPITGAETFDSTPLKDLVIMPDAAGPFSRMGVRADKKFKATPAYDKNKRPYILVTAPVSSYGIRRALRMMLDDRSWQRPGWSTR